MAGARRRLRRLVAVLALAGLAAGAGADEFLEGLQDVPLMPGLAVVADAGMVFDTPGGRIVESYATGARGRGEVIGFYAETLPALGWTPRSAVRYVREGEALVLDIFGPDGDLLVRFTLAPE